MRRLLLVRHAKSSWKFLALSDFERPLKKKGRKAAEKLGKRLVKKVINPELILSSTAARAMNTAQIFASELEYPLDDIQKQEIIYGATDDELLKVVRKIDDKYHVVMLVGHNPGLTDFTNLLVDDYIENVPTAGVVCIDFDIPSWKEVNSDTGSLQFFDYPKKVDQAAD